LFSWIKKESPVNGIRMFITVLTTTRPGALLSQVNTSDSAAYVKCVFCELALSLHPLLYDTFKYQPSIYA